MTKKEFADDWKHFCSCIDFGRSNLDADSIRFMNEGPGKILETIKQRDDLLAACEYSHTLLLRKIGQTTHAVALLEAAIAKAKT